MLKIFQSLYMCVSLTARITRAEAFMWEHNHITNHLSQQLMTSYNDGFTFSGCCGQSSQQVCVL